MRISITGELVIQHNQHHAEIWSEYLHLQNRINIY